MIDLDEVLGPLAAAPARPPTPVAVLEGMARRRRRRRLTAVSCAAAAVVVSAGAVAVVAGRDDPVAVVAAQPGAAATAVDVGWLPPGATAEVSEPNWLYERSQPPGDPVDARILELESPDGNDRFRVVVTPWADESAIEEVAAEVPGVVRADVGGHDAVVYPACSPSVAWVEGGHAVWVDVDVVAGGCDHEAVVARDIATKVDVVGGRPVLGGGAADGLVATEAVGLMSTPFPDQRALTRRVTLHPTGGGDDEVVDIMVVAGPRAAPGDGNVPAPDGGVDVTVQGRPATLHPMPSPVPAGQAPAATVTWSPRDGLVAAVSSPTVDTATLLRIAEGLSFGPG